MFEKTSLSLAIKYKWSERLGKILVVAGFVFTTVVLLVPQFVHESDNRTSGLDKVFLALILGVPFAFMGFCTLFGWTRVLATLDHMEISRDWLLFRTKKKFDMRGVLQFLVLDRSYAHSAEIFSGSRTLYFVDVNQFVHPIVRDAPSAATAAIISDTLHEFYGLSTIHVHLATFATD